jgi:chromate transporter
MQQHDWLTNETILSGYGLAQALPGPLFTFAGFLGAAMPVWQWRWLGGVLSMLALFLPGFFLLAAALPHWHWLRAKPLIRAAMNGTNAAVVGVLLAALYDPIALHALHSPTDIALAAAGFVLLTAWRVSPVIVVAGLATGSQWLR